METFLIILWVGVPVFFLILASYSMLEAASSKKAGRKEEASNLVRQTIFLAVCSLLSAFLDRVFVEPILVPQLLGFLPEQLGFVVRFAVYPLLVLVLGKTMGGLKEKKIERPRLHTPGSTAAASKKKKR